VSSIFTRIINGEIPGRIVWRDKVCVAMVDIRPLNRGHVLVIPIEEVDRWTDLSTDTASHCMTVSHTIGRVQQELFAPTRIGLIIAGFEVPHTHLHVVPIDTMGHLNFANANPNPDPDDLDRVTALLRQALRKAGYESAT
jgi:histidine triad (HIT) family protein